MTCPGCKKENDDNWPLKINDKIKIGGCQECWEEQCDIAWWEMFSTTKQRGVI